jgi:hypothetical protein
MKRWAKLFSIVMLLWGIIYLLPTALNRIRVYREFMEISGEKGIDNSALFYSEEPLTLDSEQILNEKLNPESADLKSDISGKK